MSMDPGWNDTTYAKAKLEMKSLALPKKDKRIHRNGFVWIPPHRTASGVRFGYWRREE